MPTNTDSRTPVSLADLTTIGLGGPAPSIETAASAAEVAELVGRADGAGGVLVLGGGSNLVVADRGVDVPVVRVGVRGMRIQLLDGGPGSGFHVEDARYDGYDAALGQTDVEAVATIGAGEDWDTVVAELVDEGWAGVETLSGIPGSVGATPVQNVGAYGGEIADVLLDVELYDRRDGVIRRVPASELRLGYRSSVLKGTERGVVTSVRLGLRRSSAPVRYGQLASALGIAVGEVAPAREVRAAVVELRRGKGMVLDPADEDTRSVGSFFTNPVVGRAGLEGALAAIAEHCGPDVTVPQYPVAESPSDTKLSAAWLIERAGFGKGYPLVAADPGPGARQRPARPGARIAVSSKHTLALTNRGGGTTAELIALAREIRDGVRAAFGITLRPEAVLLGVGLDDHQEPGRIPGEL